MRTEIYPITSEESPSDDESEDRDRSWEDERQWTKEEPAVSVTKDWEDLQMPRVLQRHLIKAIMAFSHIDLYQNSTSQRYMTPNRQVIEITRVLIASGNLRTYIQQIYRSIVAATMRSWKQMIPTAYPWENEQGRNGNLPGKAKRMRKPQSSANTRFAQYEITQSNKWSKLIPQLGYLNNSSTRTNQPGEQKLAEPNWQICIYIHPQTHRHTNIYRNSQ